MKTMMAVVAGIATMAAAMPAQAQDCERRCGGCVKVYEYERVELRTVVRQETVLVGYRDEVVGYRDVIVEREVPVYAERTVWRKVQVGCSHGRPVYRNQAVVEKIRIGTRCVKVCEKQPIIEKRPVYETRDVECVERVKVPVAVYVCVKRH